MGFTLGMPRTCSLGGNFVGNIDAFKVTRHIWDVKAALLHGKPTKDPRFNENTVVVRFQSPVSYAQSVFEKQVEEKQSLSNNSNVACLGGREASGSSRLHP